MRTLVVGAIGALVVAAAAGSAAATTEPPGTEPAGTEAVGTEPAGSVADPASFVPEELCAAADSGPISIVHLTDIPGEGPTAIDDFWNGSSLAVEHINDACGAEVVTLERIPTSFDVESTEPKILEAQEMDPTAIIGQGSSSQIALNNVVDEGGIPFLWPVGTEMGLADAESGSDWAWMLRPVNETQGEIWGTYLADAGFENVWLECIETQLGVSGCGKAKEIYDERGVAIAGERTHAFDASDFTSSIVDLQAAGADAVALATFPAPEIAFMQQMEDNGALDITVMGGASTEVIYQALSPAQQDNIVAIADCNPREDNTAVNDAYSAALGKDMTGLAAGTYDAVFMVVDAVARQGSTDHDAVAEGISSTEWGGVCQDYYDSGSHALAHTEIVTEFDGGVIATAASYQLNERGDALAE